MKKAIIIFISIFICSFVLLIGSVESQVYKKSCFDIAGIKTNQNQLDKELFVLIDQTTILDTRLKDNAIQKVRSVIESRLNSNFAITIIKFSAFTNPQTYPTVVTSITIDPIIPQKERNSISKIKLKQFDKCIEEQRLAASKEVRDAITKSFGIESKYWEKSDILKTLHDISLDVISKSNAKDKIILIISDMLENSSITTFYKNNAPRLIVPENEIKIAKKFIGNFAGARVFIVGLGNIPSDISQGSYRDPKIMMALTEFWENYFKLSNANLIEIGKPELMTKELW